LGDMFGGTARSQIRGRTNSFTGNDLNRRFGTFSVGITYHFVRTARRVPTITSINKGV
jgi:hypothetical protein